MPTGMRVTDPKFVKGGRKLKKIKHCTIPKTMMKVYSLNVVKKRTTTKSMQKDALNQMGG